MLDQWGGWVAWLDKYVKNTNKPAEAKKKIATDEE